MDNQVAQITELFAAHRGNLQVVMNYGGVKLYTSPTLKQNFIKAMSKTSRTAPITSTIVKLMDKGEFFPCYLTDKVMKVILKRQPPEFKGFAGLTLGKYIFVFVDSETNIFGFASNNELSITSLHELIHKTSDKFPTNFFQTFKSELTIFYWNYWNQLFSVKKGSIKPKEITEIIEFLFKTTERGKRNNKVLVEYHKKLMDLFIPNTTLDNKTIQKLITDYIVTIKIVWKGMSTNAPMLIEKAVYAHKHIISPLYTAYKNSFGINVRHIKELCYQELYAPSEVISLPALVKRPDSKVYKLINKL